MSLSPGTRLGPYEILSPLGAGGMGEVYRARDTRLGRDVAIKVLPSEFASDPERLRRFEQEAKATAALDHPNILAIHDIGIHGGTPYIVEQLLEGESLRQRLRGGPLSPAKAVEFGIQIAQGLAAAHEKGIVHRDLKPENLFITKDGRVKILDFGLARLRLPESELPEGRSEVATVDSPTREGSVLGTPGYMAPEQVRGRAVDARTDIFAFGVVLYEMLSGKRAFSGDTAADTQAAILTLGPDPLPAVTPPGLDRVVRRCLEKRPEDRYQTAREVHLALEVASTNSVPPVSAPIVALPEHPGWSRRQWAQLGGAFVLLSALAAAGLWFWKGRPSKPAAAPQMPTIKAIALFPLDDLSGNASEAYFAPGMTDALNTKLTQIRSIRVIGQASAARCKEEKMPLPKVAEALGVDAVVQGSVLRVGDTVRISVALLDARTDSNLWAESYERKMTDVLMLQGQVAQAIASAVRAAVTPVEMARMAGRPVNPKAYEEYLAGKYALDRSWGKEEMLAAVDHFKRALEIDPGFAPAYDYLVVGYGRLLVGNYLAYEEAYPLAKAAALKAMELAPSEAASHDSRSFYLAEFERDLPGAEREGRKAMELDDRDPWILRGYGGYLSFLGRDEEAIAAIRRGVELDPIAPQAWAWLSIAYFRAGGSEEGVRAMEKAAALAPESPIHNCWAGQFSAFAGDREKALSYAKKARSLPGWDRQFLTVSNLAILYAVIGQRQEALDMLRLREPLCAGNQAEELDVGITYAWLGERDRAFEHLGNMFSRGGATVWEIANWFTFPKEFRKDPRYPALLKKAGLPARDEDGKVVK